ncbi:MAG: hypothetical protein ACTHK4_17945 [Mycobacteriales bacterium]
MARLRDVSNLGKVLMLAGLVMAVFGLVRLLTPYSAAAKVGGYTANCGSSLAPKKVVTTINCNHGSHLELDLSLLLGGLVLSVGAAALFASETAEPTAERAGTYG